MWCVCRRALAGMFVALFLSACVSPQLGEGPRGDDVPELVKLFQALEGARQSQRDLLAPDAFDQAMRAYDRAQAANAEERRVLAHQGLDALRDFETAAAANEVRLAPILVSRERARAVKADQVDTATFRDLDDQLQRLARTIENDPAAQHEPWAGRISAGFQQLELDALKYDIIEDARKAIEKARRGQVDDFAPKTLMLAEEEMLLATSVLDQDRSRQAEARQHAANALAQVVHARELKAQAQTFDQEDATYEDVLIWHERFVATAFSALLPEKIMRLPDADKLQATVETLVARANQAEADRERLRTELVAAEERERALMQQSAATLTDMEQQILAARLEADAERRRFQLQAENLARIDALFAPMEADVFARDDTLVIRAHGLEFRPGSSEVEIANLPLVAKVISAIEMFPDSHILVAGHTDNQGDDTLNQRLSEERAANLARMLTQIGLIDAERIRTSGHGASQPVTSNDTRAGRSANRRVEIHIQTRAS